MVASSSDSDPAANGPVEFSHADRKCPDVIECKIEAMTEDDNGHKLLLITMILESGVESKIELWGKRIVGDSENTRLTSAEKDYRSAIAAA